MPTNRCRLCKAELIGNDFCMVGLSVICWKCELGGTCECGKPGKVRVDRGLLVGMFCDECYSEMMTECRRQSW